MTDFSRWYSDIGWMLLSLIGLAAGAYSGATKTWGVVAAFVALMFVISFVVYLGHSQ